VVNQKVAVRILGQMGYRADVAGNGLEAIDAVARQTYDVVLMDVQMPELDGFEASRELNRRWPGERPRIVAMTANAMQGDRELCAAAGMDDYVAKPIRVEELVAALERCSRRPESGGRGTAPAVTGPSSLPGLRSSAQGRRPGSPGEGRAPASEGALAAAAIDRAAVDRLAATMGGAFVTELIDTFAGDARQLIATLERALGETDLDAFRRAAHSLKSTSESLGAPELAALARELEATARTGTLEGVEARVAELGRAYETAARALEALRLDLPRQR
jgi:CheY-like chemotaxis protein